MLRIGTMRDFFGWTFLNHMNVLRIRYASSVNEAKSIFVIFIFIHCISADLVGVDVSYLGHVYIKDKK